MVEVKTHGDKIKKRDIRRSKRASTHINLKSFSTIPNEIRLYYMKTYIQSKVQDFIEEVRLYKTELRQYELRYARKYCKYEVFIVNTEQGDICLDFPDPPVPPSKMILFSSKTIRKLIDSAIRNRLNWDLIIQSEKRRIDRNDKILHAIIHSKTS